MAKLNGVFIKVLRKVLLNKVLTMKTAAITYIQTNMAKRMKMEKGPKIPQTKSVIHAHKHTGISSEQPGYFHT